MIEAILFDLDGVLVDSELHSCSATAELLTARGLAMTEPEVRRLFLGKPFAAVYEHARNHGHELPQSLEREKEELYFEKAANLVAFAGALDVLRRLRAPWAIASSGSPRKVAFSLKMTGIRAEIVCTTAEVQHGKPAPDLFLLAAKKLGIEASKCAVVEDSVPGIQAAHAAGCFAIGVTTSMTLEADAVIASIAELSSVPEIAHLFSP